MTNRKQELALGAALLPTELALKKWQELVLISEIEEFEHSVTRTLPVVYLNCKDELSGNQLLKLRGSYRHSWARNTELFMQLKPVLENLHQAAINYRLLKGGAINMLIGPPGARIMGDIDLLINKSDLHKLQQILISLGFSRMFSNKCKHANQKAQTLELNFVNEGSLEVDIHIVQERDSRRLFENMMNSSPVIQEFSGIPVKLPNKEHLICHALIHGGLNVQDEDESQAIMDVYTLLDSRNFEKTSQLVENLGIYSLFETYFHTIERIGLPSSFKGKFETRRITAITNSVAGICYSVNNYARSIVHAIWYRTPSLRNFVKILRTQKVNKILYLLWVYTGMLRPLEFQIINRLKGFVDENEKNASSEICQLNTASQWSNDWRFGLSSELQATNLRIKAKSAGFINQSFLIFLNGKLIGVTESTNSGEWILEVRDLRTWNEISFRLPFSGCKICSKSMKTCTLEILS